MDRMVVKSKVGRDGVLHLDLPLGVEEAEREVVVSVSVEPARAEMTREEWREWVESMAGSWEGDFEVMPQDEYEQRRPLS